MREQREVPSLKAREASLKEREPGELRERCRAAREHGSVESWSGWSDQGLKLEA